VPVIVGGGSEGAAREPRSDPFTDPIATALVEIVTVRGYEATDVASVTRRAGVTMAEFHRRFVDKEDCVQQVFEAFIDDFLRKIRSAFEAEPQWPTSLRAAAYSTMDWMDEHPDTARFGMVDVLAARNEMIRVRREEIFVYCAGLIDAGREVAPDPAAVPEAAAAMAVGAVVQIVTRRMQSGVDLEFGRLVPELMYAAVLPYLGEEAARAELGAPRPARPRPET
jgi:AcrR family transcriptional regulator